MSDHIPPAYTDDPEPGGFWVVLFAMVVLGGLIGVLWFGGFGCNAAPIKAASDNEVEATVEADTVLGLMNRITKLETTVGDIQTNVETNVGGGGDTIGLWIAQASGPACFIAYVTLWRPYRRHREAKAGIIDRSKK